MPEIIERQIGIVRAADTSGDQWARLPAETTAAWEAFRTYRDLGGSRSISEAARLLEKHVSQLEKWSRKWHWVSRCNAWDDHLDAQRRDEATRTAREDSRRMYERHGAQIQAAIQAMLIPITALLQRMRDPETGALIRDLAGVDLLSVLGLARSSAQLLPNLIAAERLVRGEPGVIEEHRIDVDHEHSLADEVLRDPRVADLANQLFSRIGRQQS